ncbi:tRNA (guanine(37)-N1)-methyltransferase (TRMT5) [Vairimorpha necatrix]|uniref:tRNA (Guanine(37)-N1)-methyltransferase (TRMT5) n=1 Tax=Vairimorpha necatrix TaxID=6039 RepID=A0AAX4J926_9MICR
MNLYNLITKVITLKCVQSLPSPKYKLLKLKKIPSVINLSKKYFTFTTVHKFTNLNIPVLLTDTGDTEISLILNYKYFSYSEIINIICSRQMPVSYETVGDVIHFNLNDEFLEYKYFIGKILYDKTGHTVINKIGNINNTFRNYDFEYIGGKVDINELKDKDKIDRDNITYFIAKEESGIVDINKSSSLENITNNSHREDTLNNSYRENNKHNALTKLTCQDFNQKILAEFIKSYKSSNFIIKLDKLRTCLVENGAKFHIDIKNVYWCSKLQEERRNLLSEIKPGEVVCDVFCGVGPMVIPLLQKKCLVYCNDLNKDAIFCLRENIKINKIETGFFIENLDAKIYLEKISDIRIDHFILNLPEYSIDYIKYIRKGKIHCYFFSREEEVEKLVEEKTGLVNGDIRFIRKVSPSKNVYKLTMIK